MLLAAALKTHQLGTEPVAEVSLLTSRWFLILIVECEFALSLWLLSALHPQWSWRVTLTAFTAFGGVTFAKGLSGEASCGCFGRVEINPWYTLVFDLAAVVALCAFPPTRTGLSNRKSNLLRYAIVVCVAIPLGTVGGGAMAQYEPARLTEAGQILGDGDFVLIEPALWLGKHFPLLKHIDIGSQLQHGEVVVVLYKHDCAKCRMAIRKYDTIARFRAGEVRAPRVAIIEMPPYQLIAEHTEVVHSACLRGRLSDLHRWFCVTPLAVRLFDGTVFGFTEEPQFEL